MPHRRKKSLVDDRPPKRRAANRRKAKKDATSELYQSLQQDWPTARSKQPRKAAGGKRTRSGPVRKRGKKVAVAKRPTQRRGVGIASPLG